MTDATPKFFTSGSRQVTAVGLGGEGILRTKDRSPHARRVIQEAFFRGITYFDSAPAYQDSEIYLGSFWKENQAERQKVFQASKTGRRDRKGALSELEKSLKRLHTDYLDLWQIHDIRSKRDFDALSGPDGALEAFVEAKKAGKIRNIGVTGHHDPNILARAVAEWPVDSVMLPVNPVEELLGGFLSTTLAAAHRKNIAVIGMKILGASHYILPKFNISADLLIRYALSHGITVAIVGCSSPDEVETVALAGSSKPISSAEKEHILNVFRPHARKLAFYRGVI
ncbi:MAG: aldo/keto reductase [Desulfobacterales bacterium SG8_35]|nr:MAG: aldo/keto reductase [Desulfobacterales bacterium SG8_35]